MCKLPYWCSYTLAIDFVLLEQVTFTSTTTTCTITMDTTTTPTVDTVTESIDNKPVPMPRHMSPLDSNKVLQNRNSAGQEANSPDFLTKNTTSIVPPKPPPKPRKLKPQHMSPLDSNKVLQNRNSAGQEANSPDFLTKNITSIVPPKPLPKPRKLKPQHMSSLDSNKVLQNRNPAGQEANSPDFLTKNTPSIVPPKPQPKLRKLKPANSIDNEQILSCSASPDSTSSAVGNMGTVSSCQNVSKENLPGSHIPPAMEQFAMHSEESTDVAGNFQSNTQ